MVLLIRYGFICFSLLICTSCFVFFKLGYQWWNETPIGDEVNVLDVHDGFLVRPICTKIYLREVYKVLWEKITYFIPNSPDSLKSNSVIHVSGTLGIGKTRFLYYLLCKLRDCDMKVMLTLKDVHYFLDGNPGLLSVDSSLHQELSPDIYIYDPVHGAGSPLTYFKCLHITISSPDTTHTEHVKQSGFNHQKFYMPLWSLDEILKCRSLVYPGIEESQVKNYFSIWGGGGGGGDTINLPSPVVKMKVLLSLSTLYNSFQYRNELLKTCSNTAIGNVYEGYVRSIFLNKMFGNTIPDIYKEAGKITCTFSQNKTTINIPFPTEVEFFCGDSRVSEINSQKVYIPLESNFPTVHLVYPPHLIQITTAKEHTVNIQGLKLVKTIFPQQIEWNLIFVMPEARVANFKARSGRRHCCTNNIHFYYIAVIDFPAKLQLTELQKSDKL